MPLTLWFQIFAALLCLGAVRSSLFSQKGGGGPYPIGTFGGHLPHAVKVIRVTNTVAVPVPVPIPYPKHVPYPVPVPKPIPYAVPQPIPVEVTKPVVIQQPLPLEVPKPYPVPQAYSLKSIQPHDIGLSIPSDHLTAPAFHPNQHNDYQAYLSYGRDQSYQPNQDSTQAGYGHGTYEQEQSYSTNHQEAQDAYAYGSSNQEQQYQNSYNAVSPGLYMVYGGSPYSQDASKVSLGHQFESTNSVDDQHPSGR